jgi:hypothetical protein
VVEKRWQKKSFRSKFLEIAKCSESTNVLDAADAVLSVLLETCWAKLEAVANVPKRGLSDIAVVSGVCALTREHARDLAGFLCEWNQASMKHFRVVPKSSHVLLRLEPYWSAILTLVWLRKKVEFLNRVPKDVWKMIFRMARSEMMNNILNPK